MPTIWEGGHLTEEVLEEYAFGRLQEAETAIIEEHYFHCERCVDAMEDVEFEIHTIRAAFAREALGPREAAGKLSVWERFVGALRRPAVPLAAGGLAVVALLVTSYVRTSADPAPVLLASFRGGSVVAHAPAGRPLDLTIDAAEVPLEARCRVEVVTAGGKAAWSEVGVANEGKLLVHMRQGLDAGAYWVRLYSPERELVREFGLRLE